MRRGLLAALAAAALAACSQEPRVVYVEYRSPDHRYALEVPKGWLQVTNYGTRNSPLGEYSMFVGEEQPRTDTEWLGAFLAVHRLPRERAPIVTAEVFEDYRRRRLRPVEEQFTSGAPAEVSTGTIAGMPARTMTAEFKVAVTGEKGEALEASMRQVQTALMTPDSYYVIQYRANQQAFPRHVHAYERALRSFRLQR